MGTAPGAASWELTDRSRAQEHRQWPKALKPSTPAHSELMLPAAPQYLVLWARRDKHQLPSAFPHLARLLGASRLGSHSDLDGTAWGESFHLNLPIKWAAGEGPEWPPLARRRTQPSACTGPCSAGSSPSFQPAGKTDKQAAIPHLFPLDWLSK